MSPGLALLRALRVLRGLTYTRTDAQPTLSAQGLAHPGPGRRQCGLWSPRMRAWARNESYHYGRIRRRMPLENLCPHTHLIRSVAASSRQVGSTRLQSPCHPLPPVLEAMGTVDKACPGPAGEVSPGTASEFGHHIATLSTSPLPGPYLLGVIPKSCPIPRVRIHHPGLHTLWSLLSAWKWMGQSIIVYKTLNVLLICYPPC